MSSAKIDLSRCVALVVEDEWLLRIDLVDALEATDISVLEAGTAEEAVAIVQSGVSIDILITDIRLGGALDGWDLAEIFRRASPAGAVLYASANAPLAGRQVTDSIFFTKPVPVRTVVENCLRLCAVRGAEDI